MTRKHRRADVRMVAGLLERLAAGEQVSLPWETLPGAASSKADVLREVAERLRAAAARKAARS